ncbi:MAG: hypothetical protein LBJ57_06685 [Prevotellaceae bacterium]|jgi:hypothetical protein|nr:hypothetical protein [Prevotellaceae bacterium]
MDKGIEITEFEYQAQEWTKPRRMIAVRQKNGESPQSSGKQLMAVAYNFLSLFKQIIIGGNVRNRLKTLRHRMLAIPSIIEKNDDRIIVKMALQMNHRSCIAKLTDKIQIQFNQSG